MTDGLSVEQLDAIERHAEIMSEADGAHARAGVFSSDDVLALVGMARDAIRLREEIEKLRERHPDELDGDDPDHSCRWCPHAKTGEGLG